MSGHTDGRDPISLKKLKKGDARWSHLKVILGFLIDGAERTIAVPPDKLASIVAALDATLSRSRIPFVPYRRLLGRLRHLAAILPAGLGLFSPLNKALRGEPSMVGIGKKSEVRLNLVDLRALLLDAAERPTHVNEIVHVWPSDAGYVDASGIGVGGVLFPLTEGGRSIVWRLLWPADITAAIKSTENPGGTITNSDLEQAGVVLQFAVWAAHFAPMHRSLLIFTDNASAVSWSTRMSDKSTGPIAGRLLRGLAYLRRETESAPAHVLHVPGPLNLMADFASRCRVLSDTTFLSLFTARFPRQRNSWTLVPLNSEICASIISTLRGQRRDLPSWTVKSGRPHGRHGQNTATSTGGKTRTYPTSSPPQFPVCSRGARPPTKPAPDASHYGICGTGPDGGVRKRKSSASRHC